ncbi:MAG: hydrogenase expression/formation protein HypE [Leptospirales bacterium]
MSNNNREDRITLAHGSGGEESAELIRELFLPYLTNPYLEKGEDGAFIEARGDKVQTTDSFTVQPLIFSGGDIGKLVIAGLCNDLAVMGARPEFLTLTFILEEGLLYSDLHRFLSSMQKELKLNDAVVVAADTKVVPRNFGGGLYISGSALGTIIQKPYSAYNIEEDDEIIVSGPVGEHGAVVLMERNEFNMKSDLQSDCKSLWPVISKIIKQVDIVAMRDITRGGLATILNEMALQSGHEFFVQETQIPVRPEVLGFCEILGFHPYHMACEGNFIAIAKPGQAQLAVECLRSNGFPEAAQIGQVRAKLTKKRAPALLQTAANTVRSLEPLRGEMLPRIC